jgi:hypothetical protein
LALKEAGARDRLIGELAELAQHGARFNFERCENDSNFVCMGGFGHGDRGLVVDTGATAPGI